MKQDIELEDMTHEELAVEAIRIAKYSKDSILLHAARKLQKLVDDEKESSGQAKIVIGIMRS